MAEPEANYSIGLDLGGTNLRAAAVDRGGRLLDRVSRPTEAGAGREAILSAMVEAIETLRQRNGERGLAGIGIAVPGFISSAEGVVHNSNNLTSLEGFPVRKELSRRLNTAVILENDANAAALGEWWQGAGRGVDNLVLLTLGTGVGGGIIAGGRLLRGADGMAAELGHITVVQGGNPCGCGNRGCLEKHASAAAISAMAQLMGLGAGLTAREVYGLAIAGDERARTVFAAMGESLGVALAMLVNTFNFPLFLLGGGVAAAWDLFAPAMLEELVKRSFTYRTTRPRVEAAGLGGDAGLYGAARLPWLQD